MKKGLTGNQLKIIAMICMTVDHVGFILFPKQEIFRIIGRLAFPIFAYMIAEGCRYTRNYGRYLGTMAAVAAVQLFLLYFGGSLFRTAPLTVSELARVLAISATVIPADAIRKLCSKNKKQPV